MTTQFDKFLETADAKAAEKAKAEEEERAKKQAKKAERLAAKPVERVRRSNDTPMARARRIKAWVVARYDMARADGEPDAPKPAAGQVLKELVMEPDFGCAAPEYLDAVRALNALTPDQLDRVAHALRHGYRIAHQCVGDHTTKDKEE